MLITVGKKIMDRRGEGAARLAIKGMAQSSCRRYGQKIKSIRDAGISLSRKSYRQIWHFDLHCPAFTLRYLREISDFFRRAVKIAEG